MEGQADQEPFKSKDTSELNSNTRVLDIKDQPFYSDAAKYWAKVEATDDGMLGGLGRLSRIDVQNSERFLKTLFKLPDAPDSTYSVDCGAGIGRITKNLLQRFFNRTDLVDQDEKFIQEAKKSLEGNPKVGEFFCCGLHKFNPEPSKYDVVWAQWVLSHMTDDDLIKFLDRCRSALRPRGVIVIKENCTRSNKLEHDSEDSSHTRSFQMFMDVFKKANFNVISNARQKNFPQELYPVWTFALRPS